MKKLSQNQYLAAPYRLLGGTGWHVAEPGDLAHIAHIGEIWIVELTGARRSGNLELLDYDTLTKVEKTTWNFRSAVLASARFSRTELDQFFDRYPGSRQLAESVIEAKIAFANGSITEEEMMSSISAGCSKARSVKDEDFCHYLALDLICQTVMKPRCMRSVRAIQSEICYDILGIDPNIEVRAICMEVNHA